jgi:hypothetical protein
MNIDQATTTFDQELRHFVYDQTMKAGTSPTVAETAAALSTSLADVQASFHRLADAHMLVLQRDTGKILMANPFSAVPTAFLAQVDGRTYCGNRIWDVMGIPAIPANALLSVQGRGWPPRRDVRENLVRLAEACLAL